MAIQLTGLGGFDSGSVISQLVEIARQPIREIDGKKAQVDSASTTLGGFSSKLAALKTAASALATTSGFTSMSATSSDTGIVATVTGSATTSSFSVEVTKLARAQKTRSDPQTSATTALGKSGTLTIKVGSGDPVSVSVAAEDTLADIATKIGRSGARVSAGIVNAGGSYRLTVQGLDTGTANAITFGEVDGLDLGLATPGNTYETAQNAELTVDGLPVSSATNSIAEAIPGVTLALTKTTTAPATVRLAGDSSALKTKISALVTAYNDVVNTGHTLSGYGTVKAQNSVLAADPAIRRSLDRVSSIVSGAVPNATGDYRSLSAVGISLSRDGVMSFDGAKLDAALEKGPESVRRLFVTDSQSGATGAMKTLSDAINDLVTGNSGAVKNRLDALAVQSKRLTTSRAEKEDRVKDYEQQLRRQFSKLDVAMSRYNSMANALGSLNRTNDSSQ